MELSPSVPLRRGNQHGSGGGRRDSIRQELRDLCDDTGSAISDGPTERRSQQHW
jgi:hypothetical protein